MKLPSIRSAARRGLLVALPLAVLLALPQTAPAAERPFGEGRLWRVEKPGLTPSYLYGTMHTSDPQVVELPAPVSQAFEAAERVVLELVMSPEVGFEMAKSMILADGRTLPDLIGPERFAQVVEGAQRYGLPAEQIQFFKPWAVSTFFGLPPAELQRQAAGQQPLDQLLQARAEAAGTPVIGLESIGEQLSFFTDLSEADQVALLDISLALNPEIEAIFAEMKQAYLAGDLNRLHAMSKEQSAGADPRLAELFQNRLIDRRNELMVARLAEHLGAGGAFVGIGALHMSGEEGVLYLLEQDGYQVERVL